jgi:Fic family protein
VAEKALMQGLSHPIITSLSPTLLARRKEYYAALERASLSLEITPWLVWFASTAIEAGRRGLALVEFLIRKTALLDSLRDRINPRQEKALLRMFEAGVDGFKGGMSAGKYASITGAASATATRDLADLVTKGALTSEGEKKARRYHLNTPT